MHNFWRKNKKYSILLFLLIAVGIFLRTYNFHDWLRFNDDQARDAALARDFSSGHQALPLLGPNASGTRFRLGPAYYYFQYASAKIFGASPDKLAYPDLFFSVLTIPMLFVFLKKYFSSLESLLVTALFSVSFYAVEYSRFAWNPNSLPFFSLLFLYSLLELAGPENKNSRKKLWALAAGISLGIGIQLHTLFLMIVSPVALVFFIYILRKKLASIKIVILVILAALCVNIPQIYHEALTRGENTRAFVDGVIATLSKNDSYAADISGDIVCHIRENAMIVSSFGDIRDDPAGCHFIEAKRQFETRWNSSGIFGAIPLAIGLAASVIFTLGGYSLLAYFIRREKDTSKKIFLSLLALYTVISFVMLGVLAGTELTSRYFLIVEFLPFIFLGLWIKFAFLKFKKYGPVCVFTILALLAILNLYATERIFASYEGNAPQNSLSPESVTLVDTEFFYSYITSHASPSEAIAIEDRSGDLFGVKKSITYLDAGHNIKNAPTIRKAKKDSDPFFSIDLAGVSGQEELGKLELENYYLAGSETRGRFMIFEFKRQN